MTGVAVLALSHLALIPVNALYGVQICPVLGRLGFSFGCKYTSIFVAYIVLTDFIFAALMARMIRKKNLRFLPHLGFVGHWISFFTGMILLGHYLTSLDVPALTLDRMNRAYTYAGILLTILQVQVLDWIVSGILREQGASITEIGAKEGGKSGLTVRWVVAAAFRALPFVGVLAVIAIFMNAKFTEVAGMDEVTQESISSITSESVKVIGMLLLWLAFIQVFSFLKERQLVRAVSKHLNALGRLDSNYFSSSAASGFWEDIFRGLNRTTEILGQRARLVKGFATYVTNTVAENILKGELKAEGKLQKMTILVTDLRNFTQMSNKMRPEDVVKVLNIYFTDMLEVITQFGATVDKFIGDGILAYIEPAAGDSEETCNEKGVRVSLAMHERLRITNRTLTELGLPNLRLGVGVHCGEVVIGSIGAPEKMQYTVIGDTVNVTARLESLCKHFSMGVIVSEGVYKTLDPELSKNFKVLEPQDVKGVAGKVQVYGFLSAGAADSAA